MKKEQNLWFLAILVFTSLFLFLGETSFNTKGESREAVVALSMLEQDNWILPINNGIDMAYKPPLFHWCIAFISQLTGTVSEYTSRMPSAMALAVMVLASFVFYSKRRGREVAFLMALITLTNFETHRAGTNCRVDMLLSALMVLSLYQLYRWGERHFQGIPWLGILCLSGAFLTKGPVGMMLPCLVTAVFWWMRGIRFWIVCRSLLWVCIGACVLPFLWYLAAYRQGGDEFLQLVMEENVLRFLGKMSYRSHENPIYYNFITITAGYLPYTLLILISVFFLKYRKLRGNPHEWWIRFRHYIHDMDDTRLFSLLSIVVIFVFYCIPKSKRSVYLLPVYPFIACFLAEYILYLLRCKPKAIRVFGGVMALLSALLIGLFVALRLQWIPVDVFSGRHAEENIAFMRALSTVHLGIVAWLLLGVLLSAAVWCVYACLKPKLSYTGFYPVVTLVFSLFMTLDGLLIPTVLNVKSDKPVAEHIASIVPVGKLYSCHSSQMRGNPMRQFTINFYLGDRVVPFGVSKPSYGYLIAGPEEVEQFLRSYKGYDLELIYDSRHRSCDDNKIIGLYRFDRGNDTANRSFP